MISLAVALLLLLYINYAFVMNPKVSDTPIKLATGEWAPYTGNELSEKGIVTALVTKIFNDLGYTPEYQIMSWPMAEHVASLGEKDSDIQGTFPYIENNQRKNKFYFSDTLLSLEFGLFYHIHNNPKGSDLNQIEDLKDHVILSIDGYAYPEGLKNYFDTINVHANNISAFQELLTNNDNAIVIEAKEVGEHLLEQKLPHIAGFIRQAPLKLSLHVKLMLSKSNPNNLFLIEDFNEKLKEIKQHPESFIALINSVKRNIDRQRAVVLHPYQENGLIYCYRNKNDTKSVILPNGTEAIIKEWDPSFLNFHTLDMNEHKTFVKVKLLNGPMSFGDSLYYVDGRSIQTPNN